MREPIAASGTFVLPAIRACAFGTEHAGSSASTFDASDAFEEAFRGSS